MTMLKNSKNSLLFMLLLVVFSAGIQADPQYTEYADKVVEDLQKEALSSDLAWDILASLTSDVGPRMGGTEADARAVEWAVEKMRGLGFDRVWTEPVTFPLTDAGVWKI